MSVHFCESETKTKQKKLSETRKTPSCPLRKGLTGWKKQQKENYHTHTHTQRLKHWARKQEANNSRPMWRGTLALNHLANLKQPWGKGSGSSSSAPLCVWILGTQHWAKPNGSLQFEPYECWQRLFLLTAQTAVEDYMRPVKSQALQHMSRTVRLASSEPCFLTLLLFWLQHHVYLAGSSMWYIASYSSWEFPPDPVKRPHLLTYIMLYPCSCPERHGSIPHIKQISLNLIPQSHNLYFIYAVQKNDNKSRGRSSQWELERQWKQRPAW